MLMEDICSIIYLNLPLILHFGSAKRGSFSRHFNSRVTEESGRALGVLSGTLPEAHEGINRKETPIVTRVRCVFGHTATSRLCPTLGKHC